MARFIEPVTLSGDHAVLEPLGRDHVDALEELAHRIQSRRMSDGKAAGALGRDQWNEMLTYIQMQIDMRRGPSSDECGREMQRIRILRNGGGEEKRILLI